MDGVEFVFHLAANADIRFGLDHPRKDLEQNTIATFNVLEAMRATGVRRLAFASTGSVYGESAVFPTPEDRPLPRADLALRRFQTRRRRHDRRLLRWLWHPGVHLPFRLHSRRALWHGHVFDFYSQLREHPEYLDVLGNGRQRKSYLYVQDCIDAVLLAVATAADPVNIFNLGQDEYCEVNDSIGWISEHLGLEPEVRYAGGDRGWVGDNPFIFLDCRRARALGWTPRLGIREGVIRTLSFLQQNHWIYDQRMTG